MIFVFLLCLLCAINKHKIRCSKYSLKLKKNDYINAEIEKCINKIKVFERKILEGKSSNILKLEYKKAKEVKKFKKLKRKGEFENFKVLQKQKDIFMEKSLAIYKNIYIQSRMWLVFYKTETQESLNQIKRLRNMVKSLKSVEKTIKLEEKLENIRKTYKKFIKNIMEGK
ncbi:hypothetical protein EHP00_496 [Ecytonucleospora hepatopenaei]|uniref:Uncharacterized protein n=1 Tax=Ecytonucleospora hepatopenaei TaxID=646526 RepID=A0A1W0E465_9MICR|nr:hypothetical protein EHP00_496 [Ecytonucleospora hepatopenaei]